MANRDFSILSNQAGARKAFAGSTTLKRAALYGSLIRGKSKRDGEKNGRSDELLGKKVQKLHKFVEQ